MREAVSLAEVASHAGAPFQDELAEVSELQDGWNGEGSLAPSHVVLANVVRVLSAMPVPLSTLDLTPNDNGTVSLEWETEFGYAFLEIGERKYGLTLSGVGHDPSFHNGAVEALVPQDLVGLIQRTVSGVRQVVVDRPNVRIVRTPALSELRPTFDVSFA